MSELPPTVQQQILAFLGDSAADTQSFAADDSRSAAESVESGADNPVEKPVLYPGDYLLLKTGKPEAVVVRDGILGEAVSRKVLEGLHSLRVNGRLRKAGMGRGLGRWNEESARGDLMCFSSDLEGSERNFLAPLQRRMQGLVRELQTEVHRDSESARVKLQGRTSVQIACYPGDGSHYVRHRDTKATLGATAERLYTAIYYVNPDYDAEEHGGMLRFHFDNKAVGKARGGDSGSRSWDVAPVMDRLVLFRSDLAEHSVLPSFAERWAITCWIYARVEEVSQRDVAPRTSPSVLATTYVSPAAPLQLLHSERDTTEDERIFVSIISYRDPETWPTIEDLYHTASVPQRVHVGIVWQIDEYGQDEEVVRRGRRVSKFLPKGCNANIRSMTVHPNAASGPIPARAAAQSALYGGERYYLQIDSHMRFRPHWDAYLLEQLALCNSAKPILTAYPAPYSLPYHSGGDEENLEIRPTVLVPSHFDADGILRQRGRLLKERHRTPIRSPLWAAGFSFSSAEFLRDIPYDESLAQLFYGEEMSMALRSFTHGWDFFAPGEQVVYHLWERKQRPTFWEQLGVLKNAKQPRQKEDELTNLTSYNLSSVLRLGEYASRAEARARSIAKVMELLRVDEGEEDEEALCQSHALGKARERFQFFELIGIDPRSKKVLVGAELGGHTPDIFSNNRLAETLKAVVGKQ